MNTRSKLVDRQEIAEGTMAFRFEKPFGWTFEAGQSMDITLLATVGNGRGRQYANVDDSEHAV